MKRAELIPTAYNTYRVRYTDNAAGAPCDFGEILERSERLENEGMIEQACNLRYEAVQQLIELIPDTADMEFDWADAATSQALLLLNFSAIDHFLVGDFEMCAAMFEMLLELDPEDHLDATKRLAYAYVALGEYECFDEIINDVSDKYPDKELLCLWCEFRRNGDIPEGEYRHLHSRFPEYLSEFTAGEHPADEAYLQEISKDRPARWALAREMWLQTEHLWRLFPGFIEQIRSRTA